MARETARTKADRLLIEGRLVLTHVRPGVVVRGFTRGEGAIHHLGWDGGTWWCACENASRTQIANCLYVIAAKRVVANLHGGPSMTARSHTRTRRKVRRRARVGLIRRFTSSKGTGR